MTDDSTQALAALTADERFFFEYDGYSRNSDESEFQGRTRCARASADAERRGREAGLSFRWEIDREIDSSTFSDEKPAWQLWICVAYDAKGNVVESLCGIDFGRDGSPYSSHYRRCVEAGLAAEALG